MDKCPNYAFIDGNNLHQGTQVDDWVTDSIFFICITSRMKLIIRMCP